jgi:heat shock protein HslJ
MKILFRAVLVGTLLFVMGLAAMSSTPGAAAQTTGLPSEVVNIEWTLQSFDTGSTEDLTERGVFIIFAPDETLNGFGGCNNYSGSWKANGQGLTIGPIAATRMFCADTADLETQYFTALSSVSQWSVSGNQLLLDYDNGNSTLVFTKSGGGVVPGMPATGAPAELFAYFLAALSLGLLGAGLLLRGRVRVEECRVRVRSDE